MSRQSPVSGCNYGWNSKYSPNPNRFEYRFSPVTFAREINANLFDSQTEKHHFRGTLSSGIVICIFHMSANSDGGKNACKAQQEQEQEQPCNETFTIHFTLNKTANGQQKVAFLFLFVVAAYLPMCLTRIRSLRCVHSSTQTRREKQSDCKR